MMMRREETTNAQWPPPIDGKAIFVIVWWVVLSDWVDGSEVPKPYTERITSYSKHNNRRKVWRKVPQRNAPEGQTNPKYPSIAL